MSSPASFITMHSDDNIDTDNDFDSDDIVIYASDNDMVSRSEQRQLYSVTVNRVPKL